MDTRADAILGENVLDKAGASTVRGCGVGKTTGRDEAAQALSTAHHLLTNALDAILIVSEAGRIRLASLTAITLFGGADNLAGHIFQSLFPGFTISSGHGCSEHTLSKSDGSIHDVEVTIIRVADGALSEDVVILHDITERKRYENRLTAKAGELQQKNQALESSAQALQEAKGQAENSNIQLTKLNDELVKKKEENAVLLYSVTHDLRSPLVNLQGFSQELLMVSEDMRVLLNQTDCPPPIQKRGLELLDVDMKGAINFIQVSVSHLTNIMDALLRLSRAGRVEYQLQSVDLNLVMQHIVDSMNSVIVQRGATVTKQQLPPLWGDPTALEQIFANLIGNALNYLDPKRPGIIEVGCVGEKSGHDYLLCER